MSKKTINNIPLRYELTTAIARVYIAEKHTASVAIMPLTEKKVHFTVTWGMSGTDFVIDLSRHLNKDVESFITYLMDRIDKEIER